MDRSIHSQKLSNQKSAPFALLLSIFVFISIFLVHIKSFAQVQYTTKKDEHLSEILKKYMPPEKLWGPGGGFERAVPSNSNKIIRNGNIVPAGQTITLPLVPYTHSFVKETPPTALATTLQLLPKTPLASTPPETSRAPAQEHPQPAALPKPMETPKVLEVCETAQEPAVLNPLTLEVGAKILFSGIARPTSTVTAKINSSPSPELELKLKQKWSPWLETTFFSEVTSLDFQGPEGYEISGHKQTTFNFGVAFVANASKWLAIGPRFTYGEHVVLKPVATDGYSYSLIKASTPQAGVSLVLGNFSFQRNHFALKTDVDFVLAATSQSLNTSRGYRWYAGLIGEHDFYQSMVSLQWEAGYAQMYLKVENMPHVLREISSTLRLAFHFQ